MLRMKDLPKKEHRKSTAQRSAIPTDPVTNPPLLSMSELPKKPRGRIPPEQQVFVAPEPTKILSMSDIAPRAKIARDMANRLVRARVLPKSTNPLSRNKSSPNPEIFANHIPNGIWKGKRCFIIGGGPSVKRVDLSALAGELTIGINRAYELFDPSILYGVDGQLFGWVELGEFGEESRRKFNEYKGYKAWMALHSLFPEDFYLIEVDSAKGHKIGTTKRLSFKNNSGYGAINLAAALGAQEIYLIGFDMRGNKRGKQRWWHDGYPVDYGEGIYTRYIKEITAFAPVLKKAGIKVVNLTRASSLKCFPFGDLRDVLATKLNRPLVVSFYTKNTGYEEEATRLRRELHLFGFEYDIEGIQSFGSWQKNTQYKAKFIAGMLEKHPKRNLLWLDVDSSVYQYPDLFDNANFDLGVHIIDWSKYGNGQRRDKQLANAVIYLKNVDVVRRFIHDWIRINEQKPNRIEMQTMADTLDKWQDKLHFHNIPASYCQIYDLMATEGYPVIEQRQASRQYRNKVSIDDPLVLSEKKKYDDCWTDNYKRSQCAEPLVQHVLKTMREKDSVLDIGCGDCTTVLGLRAAGVNCVGVDISLAGVPDGVHSIYAAPVWDMPFEDDQFDYTVSTDVLEHVPTKKIQKAIEEIFRVTRRKTFHVVALFDGIRHGVILHMTVKPIEWWIDQFAAMRKDNGKEDMVVIPRNVFMMGYK